MTGKHVRQEVWRMAMDAWTERATGQVGVETYVWVVRNTKPKEQAVLKFGDNVSE